MLFFSFFFIMYLFLLMCSKIPVKAVSGRLYVRVALHIYNDMSEVQRLADSVKDIKRRNSVK